MFDNTLFASLICSVALIANNAITNAADVHLLSYSAETIQQYINTAASGNVSSKCRDSLLKIEPFLSAYDTLPLQRRLFYASYATGNVKLAKGRDNDRWHFRFRECIIAAAEDTVIPSEHPMMFCTGHDSVSQMGVCLPTPCLNDHLHLLNEWKRTVKDGDDGNISAAYCTKSRQDKQWFQLYGTIAEMTTSFGIFGIVCLASVYHLLRGDQAKSKVMQIFLAFSALKTIETITTAPKNPSAAIRCMWGIRVITTLWVILGHAGVFLMDFMEEADQFKEDLINSFAYQPLTNGPISVDVFFVMGAVLCSYHWFRSIKKPGAIVPTWSSWRYWLGFYRHRALRLWPAYAYIIFLAIVRFSVMRYHENFPVWGPGDYGLMCSKHWWENILFINSFTDGHCLPWTWYIGTEFTFFAISPIFLLSLKWSPIFGIFLAVVTIAVSSISLAVKTLRYNFPPTLFLFLTPKRFNQDSMLHQTQIYVKPQYRIGSYLVGLITGYILSTYEESTEGEKQAKPSKRFVCIGWIVCAVTGLWPIYGTLPCLQGWNWPTYHIAFAALHRISFALSISWIIYACQRGLAGWLNNFLSMRIFLPLSAACYTLYLGHVFAIFAIYMSSSFPIPYEGFATLISYYWKHLLLCYFVAGALMLCIEMPAVQIVKILLGSMSEQLVRFFSSVFLFYEGFLIFGYL
ncbi:unnamed protein product [Toxocara canis]|uniref:Acyl_transf_3 domain-containing protein n=1 Tax=Toxocara canis TaxID=6265 RepID=A0A183V3Q5_TOXCA|nr:unnamed protein product [Toxocara canis]